MPPRTVPWAFAKFLVPAGGGLGYPGLRGNWPARGGIAFGPWACDSNEAHQLAGWAEDCDGPSVPPTIDLRNEPPTLERHLWSEPSTPSPTGRGTPTASLRKLARPILGTSLDSVPPRNVCGWNSYRPRPNWSGSVGTSCSVANDADGGVHWVPGVGPDPGHWAHG
jgi:hypothetical protein